MVGIIMGRQMTARVTVRRRDQASVRRRQPDTVRGRVQKAKVQVGGSDRTFAARLVDILIASVVAYFAF